MLCSLRTRQQRLDIEQWQQLMVRAARRVPYLHALTGGGTYPLEGSDSVVGIDTRASTAHDLRHLGVGSDHSNRRELLALQGKRLPLILQHDDALCRSLAYQGALFWQVDGLLLRDLWLLEKTGSIQQAQQAAHALIESRLCHLAALDGLQQLLATPLRMWHLQVESGIHRGGGAFDRKEPVGHDHSIETPLVPQNLRKQIRMLRGGNAVDVVVGRHHRPCTGFAHGGPERRQINFAQSSFAYLRTEGESLEFLVVAHVVLDGRADALALQAPNIGDGQPRREVRVF